MINIVLSARHSSANNAATYQQDAATKFHLAMRERYNESNRIGLFMSRHLMDDSYAQGTTWSTPFQKDLPDLVDWWYNKCLHMEGKPFSSPITILEIALKERSPNGCSTVNFSTVEKSLTEHIRDSSLVQGLMEQVRRLTYLTSMHENSELLQRLKNMQAQAAGPSIKQVLLQKKRAASAISTMEENSTLIPRKSVYLTRSRFSECKTTESKIEFLRVVHEEFVSKTNGGDKEALTDACKRWYNRTYIAVQCLDRHFSGDMAAFKSHHNIPLDYVPGNFKCPCLKKKKAPRSGK